MSTQESHEFLRPWLAFKVIEFFEAGYDTVSSSDLEQYIINFLWKRHKPKKYLEQLYQINAISPNDYFDYQSIEAQVRNVTSLNEIDFSELF